MKHEQEISKNGKCINCIFGVSVLTGFTRTFDCLSKNPNCMPDTREDKKSIYYVDVK